MFKKIIGGGKAMVLADQAVVSGAALLTQLLIVKALGLQLYGRFSAIVLIQLFILSIQQAAISGMYMVVYPGLKEANKKSYLSGVVAIALNITIGISLCGSAIYSFFSSVFSPAEYAMVLINIAFYLLQDLFRRILLTHSNFTATLWADVINNGLQLAGISYLIITHTATLFSILLVCGSSFIPAVIYAAVRLKTAPATKNIPLVWKHHSKDAIWMTGSALLQWFAGNFYTVMAGWLLGAVALSILRLGQYIFGIFNVMLQAIESYLLPRAGATAGDPVKTVAYLKTVQKKMMLAASVVLALVCLCTRTSLAWLHIKRQDEVTTVIYGMCAVYFFVVAGYPVRIALRILKHTNKFFAGYALNAVFGLCTAYWFVHSWNINGVLAGLLLSQIVVLTYWISILQTKYKAAWK